MRRGRTVQVSVTADQLEQWHRASQQLERTAAMLRVYQRGGQVMVAVEDVLDLLGQDPAAAEPQARKEPGGHPHDDPLTGARWPGPPGSTPPGR
jgi:hypothetical protein